MSTAFICRVVAAVAVVLDMDSPVAHRPVGGMVAAAVDPVETAVAGAAEKPQVLQMTAAAAAAAAAAWWVRMNRLAAVAEAVDVEGQTDSIAAPPHLEEQLEMGSPVATEVAAIALPLMLVVSRLVWGRRWTGHWSK